MQLPTNTNQYRLQKANSNTWITIRTGLTDAAFANLQNNQSDFRFSGEAYIRQITITKGALDPTKEPVPVTSGSSYSEFKGKSVAGYQAWFTASESNSGWVHWSANTRPNVNNFSFEVYPDISDYPAEQRKQSGFGNLGNGEPATLFSSADVIDEYFKWMKETGIDGVALQRFIGDPCFYNPALLENNNVALPICEIEKNEANAKNGWYVLKASGNPTSQSPATYGYKFAEVALSGSYLAYFDDILNSTKKDNSTGLAPIKNNQLLPFVTSKNRTLIFNNIHINSYVKVYNISGKLVSEFVLNSNEVSMDLRNGIYLVQVINNQGTYNQKIIF